MQKNDLFQIKRDMEAFVGEKIQLTANKGRKKTFVKEGVLENIYPSIFVVKFENDNEATRRVSYSYTDVLTSTVEIIFCREEQSAQVS